MVKHHLLSNRAVHTFMALIAILLLSSIAHGGGLLFVDDDAPPEGDGKSWDTAYRFLADALVAAGKGQVGEIRVAQGVYQPDRDEANPDGTGDREATFQLINGLALMGGYAGIDAKDPDARDIELYETILSGDLLGNDEPDFKNNDENSFHVVRGDAIDETAVLDGFSITAGNADGPGDQDQGGGMYNSDGASPTVTSCTFVANSADFVGGGMCNLQDSSPTVIDCTFNGNLAGSPEAAGSPPEDATFPSGGGMYNSEDSSPIVIGCTFVANAAAYGGGMTNSGNSSPTVIGCTFVANTAGDGGGMLNASNSNPAVTDCIFSGNSAYSWGGGMYNRANSNPTVANCTFSDNSAGDGGGMLNFFSSNPTVTNCTFSDNSAGEGGGGMLNFFNSNPTVTNCTFSGNSAEQDGGGMFNTSFSTTTLAQCTFSGNTADRGGAVANFSGADASFIGCTFTSNTADTDGGAMWNRLCSIVLKDCVLQLNTARNGGAVYNQTSVLTLNSVTFTSNEAILWGGGMYSTEGSVADLDSCVFQANQATSQGGGGMLFTQCANEDQPMTMADCLFVENVGNGPAIAFGSDCYAQLLKCQVVNNVNSSGINNGAISGGQVVMEGCFIAENFGPGTYAFSDSTYELRDCSIQGDSVVSTGFLSVDNCTFNSGGVSVRFGGVAKVEHSTFDEGGLVAVLGAKLLLVSDCVISGNSSQGIYLDDSPAVIANCLIRDCQWGIRTFGGNELATIINSVFTGNEIGLVKVSHYSVQLANCTFSANRVAVKDISVTGEFRIDNSIIADPIDATDEEIVINYSDVVDGWNGPGIGNISADPLFVDPINGDFRLSPGSPCIDAGNNWGVPVDVNDYDEDGITNELFPVDLDGNPRFNADENDFDSGCGVPVVVDMGAYEYQFDPVEDVIFADLNGDGSVGVVDLLGLLGEWGPCAKGCCLADLDLDGAVGYLDLSLLLANWD